MAPNQPARNKAPRNGNQAYPGLFCLILSCTHCPVLYLLVTGSTAWGIKLLSWDPRTLLGLEIAPELCLQVLAWGQDQLGSVQRWVWSIVL